MFCSSYLIFGRRAKKGYRHKNVGCGNTRLRELKRLVHRKMKFCHQLHILPHAIPNPGLLSFLKHKLRCALRASSLASFVNAGLKWFRKCVITHPVVSLIWAALVLWKLCVIADVPLTIKYLFSQLLWCLAFTWLSCIKGFKFQLFCGLWACQGQFVACVKVLSRFYMCRLIQISFILCNIINVSNLSYGFRSSPVHLCITLYLFSSIARERGGGFCLRDSCILCIQ